VQPAAARRQHTVDRPAICRLDGLGHQLAERADVRRHDGQCAGERPEPDDVDPYQCPDQRIDAAQCVEASSAQKMAQTVGCDVAGGKKPERDAENGGEQSAEKGNGQRLAEGPEIKQKSRPALRVGRQHQPGDVDQPAEAGHNHGR
jgi:hypothetical protein